MELKSMQEAGFDNFAKLLALPKRKLRRIYATSAYYDHESIKQLIQYMSKCGASGKKAANLELVIVLDRRVTVDECLRKLDEKIRDDFGHCNSGIYLSSLGELFHSKGYLVESQSEGKCAIGSLNLTQKGLNLNEELLAFSEYRIESKSYDSKFAGYFKDYLGSILCDKFRTHRVSEIEKHSRMGSTVRDFFLAGQLYYEADATGPFGFKLDLPQGFLKGWTPISNYLETNTSDILDVRKLLDERDLIKEDGKKRSRWKRYCFQTCYGYWAPECHFDFINQEIGKNDEKYNYYKEVFALLQEKHREIFEKLSEECQRLVVPVSEYMGSDQGKRDSGWKFLSKKSQSLDKKKLCQNWSVYFCKLMEKNQDEYIRRLCRNVRYAKMPDVWEDGDAVKDFQRSFCDSFLYELNKNQSQNELLKRLQKHGAGAHSCWKQAVERWLEQDDL